MGVRMIRWRQWPTRKYDARVVVRRMEGLLGSGLEEDQDQEQEQEDEERLVAEVRWKGSGQRVGVLRRVVGVKRNFTREAAVGAGGVVLWDEEFGMVCALTVKDKDGHPQSQGGGLVQFQPWEVEFTVYNVSNQAQRNKASTIIGTATLDLAEYASAAEEKEFELTLPLQPAGDATNAPLSLSVFLSLVELRTTQEVMEVVQRPVVPVSSPSQSGEVALAEKDDLSAIKAGLRKVKIFTDLVSSRKAKKTPRVDDGSEGRYSARSEDGDPTFDSDFLDDTEEGGSDDANGNPNGRMSFRYGTLADAKIVGGSFYSSMRINGEIDDWLYCSRQISETGFSGMEDPSESIYEPQASRSIRRILPWRKRKLGFRSPKARGEPLLKKANAEEGGDDIDFARRQLSSDDSMSYGWYRTDDDPFRSSESEFGEDSFVVGTWEKKEITSRDGLLKLNTQVFFASIDQRSERAAGESACTALVAVIADWFQSNPTMMPIKSQFDGLIRDGSLEWRNLCEIETYRQRFLDKHFDLDTVLEAKVRPISVVSGKSFVGFFHPEGMNEENFGFLVGAMSFDEIWDEISRAGEHCLENSGGPLVYIISWNDHFFILLVKEGAYYIIDTLGERLHEGCTQAYILRFDSNSVIARLPQPEQSSCEKETPGGGSSNIATQKKAKVEEKKAREDNNAADTGDAAADTEESSEAADVAGAEDVVCSGKESCKEYIKSFLAAIPIRELQDDVRRGLVSSAPLHHRLQIEFHYTQRTRSQPVSEVTEMETEPLESTTAVEVDMRT